VAGWLIRLGRPLASCSYGYRNTPTEKAAHARSTERAEYPEGTARQNATSQCDRRGIRDTGDGTRFKRLAGMRGETEQAGATRTPIRWLRHIDIRMQPVEDGPPISARPRFAWNVGEVSGSLGDLGTFLPHIVGAITVVKMDPTGILTTFGLFYAFSGAFYGVPMAVQPMKAASAAVLIEPMEPAAIAGAGLVIGAFFLILGLTGVVSRLARALRGSIAAGLQLGLGLSLAALGIRLIETQVWLGVVISALMLALMRYQRSPVALVAVESVRCSGSRHHSLYSIWACICPTSLCRLGRRLFMALSSRCCRRFRSP
jgi:hypothetical protein